MFFTLILENENGNRIDLSQTANKFMFSKIEGLNPPAGTISTSRYAGMDGSYLNNAFIEKRNVVISFEMRGFGVEKRRHELYKVVKPSRHIKIYYKTANISVYAEGIVETCEVENFEMLTNGQISIICPDIYWYSTETQIAEYSQILPVTFSWLQSPDNYSTVLLSCESVTTGDYYLAWKAVTDNTHPKIKSIKILEG